jgi:hypothetical protein
MSAERQKNTARSFPRTDSIRKEDGRSAKGGRGKEMNSVDSVVGEEGG